VGGILGIVCGLVAAAPVFVLFARERRELGRGVAAIVFSFVLIQLAMLAVRSLWPAELLPFGSLAAISFMLAVVVAVLRKG
jgi:hypothetical protein